MFDLYLKVSSEISCLQYCLKEIEIVKQIQSVSVDLTYMASSSRSDLYHIENDSYFAVIHDDDDLILLSDEKYAEELQLQETIIFFSTSVSVSAS